MELEYGNVYHQTFEIQGVLERRQNPRTGREEFLVQWKKWPNDPTWEPRQNIQGFVKSDLLSKYGPHDAEYQFKNEKMFKAQENKQLKNIPDQKLNQYIIKEDSLLEEELKELQQKNVKYTQQQLNENKKFGEFEKIIDMNTRKNIVEYLVQFSNSKQPQWFNKENLQDYQSEIEKYEKGIYNEKKNIKEEYIQTAEKNYNQFIKIQNTKDVQIDEEDFEFEKVDNTSPLFLISQKINQQKKQNTSNKIQPNISDINGNLQFDQIGQIEVEIKYKVNWKQRDDGITPQPLQINLMKQDNISAQDFVDWLQVHHLKQQRRQ